MGAQSALTHTPHTSPESLARMEAVVNLYQEIMKNAGKTLSSLLLQDPCLLLESPYEPLDSL